MANNAMRFLYRLNVYQSTIILTLLSIPWLFYLLMQPRTISTSINWAYTALIYFILSFILYLFLQWISRSGRSNFRKKLVTFTRIYIRFHVAAALLGVTSLLMHVLLMAKFGLMESRAGVSGMIAIGGLAVLLFTGYLRKRKSSGKRRRFHRFTAYLFLFFVLIHMLL
ncbi:hypothetical protein [Alkalihalobacillus sp. TS-13]|uniref:hypothetical protein n=1 Tax=Alkalihalobacillus sp. TS-13 TaxID=2842455 RepID=UPI001C86FD62|nr:hypothetical protein [Alkalihalobacillus sp. TS-13]